MARVCVGCGLTTDINDLLILNLPDAWPFAGCNLEDAGQNLYCSPIDGIIRTEPASLARTSSLTGGVDLGNNIPDGDTETVDTMQITLTNPSQCYSARAFITFEADCHLTLDPGDGFLMALATNRYIRFINEGATMMDTVSWQLSRSQVQTLTPGQVLVLNVAIDVTAIDGSVQVQDVNWRANAIIVATQ